MYDAEYDARACSDALGMYVCMMNLYAMQMLGWFDESMICLRILVSASSALVTRWAHRADVFVYLSTAAPEYVGVRCWFDGLVEPICFFRWLVSAAEVCRVCYSLNGLAEPMCL